MQGKYTYKVAVARLEISWPLKDLHHDDVGSLHQYLYRLLGQVYSGGTSLHTALSHGKPAENSFAVQIMGHMVDVFCFAGESGMEHVELLANRTVALLAWWHDSGQKNVAVSKLSAGLSFGELQGIEDQYGHHDLVGLCRSQAKLLSGVLPCGLLVTESAAKMIHGGKSGLYVKARTDLPSDGIGGTLFETGYIGTD